MFLISAGHILIQWSYWICFTWCWFFIVHTRQIGNVNRDHTLISFRHTLIYQIFYYWHHDHTCIGYHCFRLLALRQQNCIFDRICLFGAWKGKELQMGTGETQRVVLFREISSDCCGNGPRTCVDECNWCSISKFNSSVMFVPYFKKMLAWNVKSMLNQKYMSMSWIYGTTSCMLIEKLSLSQTWSTLRLFVLIFFCLLSMWLKHGWHLIKKGLLLLGLTKSLIYGT